MKTKCLAVAVAVVGLFEVAAPARAQTELVPTPVSISSPPLFEVELFPGDVSPTVTAGVAGAEAITGIQLSLIVAPDAGAAGTLDFNSVAFAASDFLFGGGNLGLNQSVGSGALFAATSSTDVGGVVPGPGQDQFVDFDFTASPDASGTFLVTAVPGSADTAWFDSAFGEQFFTFSGSTLDTSTVIGRVTVVPEPGSLILTGVAALGLAGYGLRRRLRPKPLAAGSRSDEGI